jgi:endonuclease/exonuclease/phosphatase (EEP) superfamily protein YafD
MTDQSHTNRLLILALTATLLGCAGLPVRDTDTAKNQSPLANHEAPAAHGAESCQAAMASPLQDGREDSQDELDPSRIELFVWNMQKGAHPDSYADLGRLAASKDLVLIQEARLEQQPVDALRDARYWSFAPGYKTDSASTGVMTLSAAAPLTHCHLSDREPWLRSPKAISITHFGLEETDQTLAVVNVHAVNFTLGITDFQRQLKKIVAALSAHKGPVILAGDFNTWRDQRMEILNSVAQRLALDELTFDSDNRVTPFGSIVDHVFVRGLNTVETSTEIVESSDHNPMSITLSL